MIAPLVAMAAVQCHGTGIHLPCPPISQVAFDRLTEASASQQARAVTQAADQRKSFDDQLAQATLQASDQKAQFDGELAEAKFAAGCMQHALDQLLLDRTEEKAAFESQLARAEHDAGGMKASWAGPMRLSQQPITISSCNAKL